MTDVHPTGLMRHRVRYSRLQPGDHIWAGGRGPTARYAVVSDVYRYTDMVPLDEDYSSAGPVVPMVGVTLTWPSRLASVSSTGAAGRPGDRVTVWRDS